MPILEAVILFYFVIWLWYTHSKIGELNDQ